MALFKCLTLFHRLPPRVHGEKLNSLVLIALPQILEMRSLRITRSSAETKEIQDNNFAFVVAQTV